MSMPVLIAVDWGSSNFRAYLYSSGGEVLSKLFSPHGIYKLKQSDLEVFLQQKIKDWLISHPGLPIIFCGMVGSRSGIMETAYISCPLRLVDLAAALVEFKSTMQRKLFIVPGISTELGHNSLCDVMRGEETQLVGVMQILIKNFATSDSVLRGEYVICMPGTHCKWAYLQEGAVQHFHTYMTGEIFSLILQTPSIAKALSNVGYQDKTSWPVFLRGVKTARLNGGMLADLFNIRAQLLLEKLAVAEVRDYLSGLLIAYEIMQAKRYTDLKAPIVLVAGGMLAKRYAAGFAEFGLDVKLLPSEEVTQRGLFYLAQESGLL